MSSENRNASYENGCLYNRCAKLPVMRMLNAAAAGKCFIRCLLPGKSQASLLAGHLQPFWAADWQQLSRWATALVHREGFLLLWAFTGECSKCGSGTDNSCAGSFCGMLLLCMSKWARAHSEQTWTKVSWQILGMVRTCWTTFHYLGVRKAQSSFWELLNLNKEMSTSYCRWCTGCSEINWCSAVTTVFPL